jgi:hypothetical protein
MKQAREIANRFVLEHKSTFGQVDEKEITAAVEKVARAIKGVQVASQKAQRLSQQKEARGLRASNHIKLL